MRRRLPLAAMAVASSWLACEPSRSGADPVPAAEGRDAALAAEAATASAAAQVATDAGGVLPSCAASAAPAGWRLKTDGKRIVDEVGREVVLRGVNAGGHSKQPPNYVPFDFAPGGFDAALASYMDRAASWGVNVLRVPFMWAAAEPQKGVDDDAYLQRYDAILEAAWARRIWTIVDFHQDVYAEALCGDGFPAWTLAEPNMTPRTGCSSWFTAYQTDATVKSSFDRFWSDEDGIRTAFGAVWDRIVARYMDRPGVIGFEPLNEPGWGNAILPIFEATTLTTFFTEMATRIGGQAPDALVFFDLPGIDALTVATSLQRPSGKNLVFAPHYYQASTFAGLAADGSRVHADLAKWAARGDQWSVPTFVGEFGVSHDAPAAGDYVSLQFRALDALGIHGALWEYSVSTQLWNEEPLGIVRADGSEYPLVDALVRVYPRAVAGTGVTFSYDAAPRRFTLDYSATPGGVTEVAVPPRTYPSGPRVVASGACADLTGLASEGIVRLLAESRGPVRVTITP